ncbi:MAG: 2-amino-4-hydroxy-6-hydroxymethyldihydropteridine diphosphokinase [Burkholderiaceae bacterium]
MILPDTKHVAFVSVGANLGEASQTVTAAIARLSALPGITLKAQSSLYRTAPFEASGPDFINAAVRIETTLRPAALLKTLLDLEMAFGRERPFRHAPRTLDLDLLIYDKLQLTTPFLTLPHPRMHQRAFVLAPLAEISPTLVLEPYGRVDALLNRLADQPIERLSP